ncbi:hypothetical protein QMZ92_34900 [Streptomyces sp. HNM0645]|uniref:hypothetical protein n=1 Tax=Streptomyces sp. HNM0645 TaxID=2782343 RepID=UPI0024B75919|nr:hypothetical protein [Streptomyces sp. HNM0645]MDI9889365.1 hypothetical protein [Streptomyces sp. HNM0645]
MEHSGGFAFCYRCCMSRSADLLRRLRDDPALVELLSYPFEFDIRRADYVDAPRLMSGISLEVVAGDFTGGKFYLCGEGPDRPMLYASSEGEAGLIASDFSGALGLVVGLPYWRDCLKYSEDGDVASMQAAASFLQRDMLANDPEVVPAQSRVAGALGLTIEPVPTLVDRLHEAVRSADPGDVFLDETGEYESLFGPFPPSRNPDWQ